MNKYGMPLFVTLFPFALVVELFLFAVPTGFGQAIYGNTTALAVVLGIAWFVATDCAFLFTRTVSFQAKAALQGPNGAKNLADLMQIVANSVTVMQVGSGCLLLFSIVMFTSQNPILHGWVLLVVVFIGLVLTGSNALIFCMGPLRVCADNGVFELNEYAPHLVVQLIPLIGAVDCINVKERCKKKAK